MKIKVLTIQFDVTSLSDSAIRNLTYEASVQGEDVSGDTPDEFKAYNAYVLNTSVKEIETTEQ